MSLARRGALQLAALPPIAQKTRRRSVSTHLGIAEAVPLPRFVRPPFRDTESKYGAVFGLVRRARPVYI
jgi:hypothetical protein